MSGNLLGYVPLREIICLYGGLIFRLMAAGMTCSVFMRVFFK